MKSWQRAFKLHGLVWLYEFSCPYLTGKGSRSARCLNDNHVRLATACSWGTLGQCINMHLSSIRKRGCVLSQVRLKTPSLRAFLEHWHRDEEKKKDAPVNSNHTQGTISFFSIFLNTCLCVGPASAANSPRCTSCLRSGDGTEGMAANN